MSETYVPVNFKHSRSTTAEAVAQSLLWRSALDDQLYWAQKQPREQDCVALEVGVWCSRSYFVLPRTQEGLQFVLPTAVCRITAVCERWWDPRTAYPLLTSSHFDLISPVSYPSPTLHSVLEQASKHIAPSILRVRSTQLQLICQTRTKYFALLSVVMLLWGIFTLVAGVSSVDVVGPVCAGAAVLALSISALLTRLSVRARQCYREIHLLLQEFCVQHENAAGYTLRPIGPFSLVVQRSVP